MTQSDALRPIAMLTHSYYEEDPRVRREAEALAARGWPVVVFALRRPGDDETANIDGVCVHLLDVQRHQGAGLATYLAEYGSFFVRAGWALTGAHRRCGFGLVQVHTLPDFLVFAAAALKAVGVPILLDLHEAMPEFFRIRFPRSSAAITNWLLRRQEQAAVAFASSALTVNEALRDRLVDLGVPEQKIHVVRNTPSLSRFDPEAYPSRPFMADGVLRLVYAGALSPVYELDVALDAIASLASLRPDLVLTLELYGRDFGEMPLADRAASLGIGDRVHFHGRIAIEEVPAALAAADVGLAPTRRNPFTDYSLSTKLLEYAAMGRPVVASRLPMVERTFPADSVLTYEPGDPAALAGAILQLVDDAADREARVTRTSLIVRDLSWEREADRYAELVRGLVDAQP